MGRCDAATQGRKKPSFLDLGSTKTSSALSVQYGAGTASKKTLSLVLQEVVVELLAAIATGNKYYWLADHTLPTSLDPLTLYYSSPRCVPLSIL